MAEAAKGPNDDYEAYVDGSYQDGRVGYGAVILRRGQACATLSGPVAPEQAGDARNVAGELYAVGYVLQWCRAHQVSAITLYHDYEGLAAWAQGRWKAKTPITQRYVNFLKQNPLQIRWVKVKAHSDNPWNDRADALARAGAQLGTRMPAAERQEQQLMAICAEYQQALARLPLEAAYLGFLNQQFARMQIGPGRMDLYHSARQPLKAHFTAGVPPEARSLWQQLRSRLLERGQLDA